LRSFVHGDEYLAKAIVNYPSIAVCGWTWPSEQRLAGILNESTRNVRKREKRLREAGVLVVVAPSEGCRSNRYVPILDGQPLFEAALSSNKVRDAVASLGERTSHTGTPVPPSSMTDAGMQDPLLHEPVFRHDRNARSGESLEDSGGKETSPTPNPAPSTSPVACEEEEEETIGGDLTCVQDAADARATTGNTTAADAEPVQHFHHGDEDAHAEAVGQIGEQSTPRMIEFSFERLMRDYPHPPGADEIAAYRPTARAAWRKLTPEQKQEAVGAVPSASGKDWLGHWLNDGHETGHFEILQRPAVVPRVWVRQGTPQWDAWVSFLRRTRRTPPTTQHRVDGELQTGWMFESEWPPAWRTASGREA